MDARHAPRRAHRRQAETAPDPRGRRASRGSADRSRAGRGREARTPAAARQDAQEGQARSRPGDASTRPPEPLHPFRSCRSKSGCGSGFRAAAIPSTPSSTCTACARPRPMTRCAGSCAMPSIAAQGGACRHRQGRRRGGWRLAFRGAWRAAPHGAALAAPGRSARHRRRLRGGRRPSRRRRARSMSACAGPAASGARRDALRPAPSRAARRSAASS